MPSEIAKTLRGLRCRLTAGECGGRAVRRRAAAAGCLVALAFVLAATAPAAEASRLIVGFDKGTTRAEQKELLGDMDVEVNSWLKGRAVAVSASGAEGRELMDKDAVRFVEPDRVVRATSLPASDPQVSNLWGIIKVRAPEGWASVASWPEVTVAITDTGGQLNHEDLAGPLWTNPGETAGNGIDDDGNGLVDDIHGARLMDGSDSGDPSDDYGHGTHVAGTVGADHSNNLGVAGMAPNARMMHVKFLGSNGMGSISDGVRAIDYAVAEGAKVINCSWGSNGASEALDEAIDRARRAGVLIVAAAGNSGQNSDLNPFYPAASSATNVISVAATDSSDALAWFSNFGATSVDLAAPGMSIRSSILNGGSGYMSGTSMASPHVAGAAAVLWAEKPGAGYWDIRRALLGGVAPLPSLSGKMVSGGRLDLVDALTFLRNEPSQDPPAPPAPQNPAPTPPAPDPTPPAPEPSPPVLTSEPKIWGEQTAPGDLRCNGDIWTNPTGAMVTVAEWIRSSATVGYGRSYKTGPQDVGKKLECRITATNQHGSAQFTVSTGPISVSRLALPVVGSKPKAWRAGAKLYCAAANWQRVTRMEYAWVIDGRTRAAASSWKPSRKLAGKKAYCRISGSNDWGTTVPMLSNAIRISR